jgi:hypothetical protein
MAGQQIRLKPLQVLAALSPQDGRHLQQARAPERFEIGPQGSEGGVPHGQGRGRQMGGAGGSPGALVAEPCLHDPPRPAPRSERGA